MSDHVLSDESPSFILSDGGTRRRKYADIVSWPTLFFLSIHDEQSLIFLFLDAVSDPLHAKKVPSWWHLWLHFLTHRSDSRLGNNLLLVRSAVERYTVGHFLDYPWRSNLLLHGHADREGIKYDAVQSV